MRYWNFIQLSLAVLLLWATLPASAILIRHDRDDAAYRGLADGFDLVCNVGGGQGTLIEPRWILTAAHVADSLPRQGGTVRCDGKTVAVDTIYLHPDYALEGKHRDLALLHLAKGVTDVPPARLYDGSDEQGMQVTFVGDGLTGTGKSGVARGEAGKAVRVRRAAHNRVSGTEPGWVTFIFDTPPAGEDLEGISGPGDSGGPALIEADGSWVVIGVSAYNDGDPECVYGSTEYYSRVSDELPWIRAVMQGKLPAQNTAQRPRLMRFDQGEGAQATVERSEPQSVALSEEADDAFLDLLGKLVAAVRGEDKVAFVALFSDRLLAQYRAEGMPPESMLEFLSQARAKRGDFVRFHPLSHEGLRIEDSAYPMRPVVFHLEDGMPGYFGIAMDEAGKIDHFSLFVMPSVCAQGASCTLGGPLEALEE